MTSTIRDALPPLPEPRALPVLASGIAGHARGYTADQMREYGEACARAALATPQVPPGFVLVPERPTEEMLEAMMNTPWLVECKTRVVDNVVTTTNAEHRDQRYIIDGWIAMLAAAPPLAAAPKEPT